MELTTATCKIQKIKNKEVKKPAENKAKRSKNTHRQQSKEIEKYPQTTTKRTKNGRPTENGREQKTEGNLS